MPDLDLFTLTDGGQSALAVAERIADFIGEAKTSLLLAQYDLRLEDDAGDLVRKALTGARSRGVAVRIIYNMDHGKPIPVPPPAHPDRSFIDSLGAECRPIVGVPDLMHHKYVVRDSEAVWTGSMNWTNDSFTRQENAVITIRSAEVAAAFAQNFEEFWTRPSVQGTGDFTPKVASVGDSSVQPWFLPGKGKQVSHRIAAAIGRAKHRVRIASPVLTSGPILGTVAEMLDSGIDLGGIVDRTQMVQVLGQWRSEGHAAWKVPAILRISDSGTFSGKRSVPYSPGSLHNYMHCKVTVVDDLVFIGSFNLSHSGEMNAENVVEIHDGAMADHMAEFIDGLRKHYPKVELS